MSEDDDKHREPDPPKPNSSNRWTRDQKLAGIGIIVALIVGAATVLLSLQGGSSGQKGGAASRPGSGTAPGAALSTHTQQAAPAPRLTAGATCATVRQAAAIGGPQPRRILVGSPGELSGGSNTMEARLLSNRRWAGWLRMEAGEEAELGVQLFDTAYGAVENVTVLVRIVEHANGCWRLGGAMRYATDGGHPTALGPVLIQLQPGNHANHLVYVERSTRLLDKDGKELTKLPDGVLDGPGVILPYSVPPADADIYYVNFRMRLN